MYILKCNDGSYYTGSTIDLEVRLEQHQTGKGANHTKKRLPVKLVYYERYPRIDWAFEREKQVQGWSRKKKEALINGEHDKLPELALAYRDVASRASATQLSPRPKPGALEGEVPPRPEALEGRTTNEDSEMLSSRASDNKLRAEALQARITEADSQTLSSSNSDNKFQKP